MKTKDFGRMLIAFAGVADFQRSGDLHSLARFFEQGSNETMVARVKRLHPSAAHPALLKQSLESLNTALNASGAKKQTQIVSSVLTLFAGRGGATVEAFLTDISTIPNPRLVPPGPLVDVPVATAVVDQLSAAGVDEIEFNRALTLLRSPRDVSVPTLAHIARCILGERACYRDRKSTVRAIARHYEARARHSADGAAEQASPTYVRAARMAGR